MKKIITELLIFSIVFCCTACSNKKQEYVAQPMTDEVRSAFKAEYRPGDMAVFGLPNSEFKNFVKNPSEELLFAHNSNGMLFRIVADEAWPIERIEVTDNGIIKTPFAADFPIAPFDNCYANIDTILLVGKPQALQEYLAIRGYACNVEKAYMVYSDYYNIIWAKGSDCSYFIRLHYGEPHSIYTPERLTDVIVAEF